MGSGRLQRSRASAGVMPTLARSRDRALHAPPVATVGHSRYALNVSTPPGHDAPPLPSHRRPSEGLQRAHRTPNELEHRPGGDNFHRTRIIGQLAQIGPGSEERTRGFGLAWPPWNCKIEFSYVRGRRAMAVWSVLLLVGAWKRRSCTVIEACARTRCPSAGGEVTCPDSKSVWQARF
ncbi:MAG: hypothetical protein QOI01_1349 [Mycobacterium sp.]|jgi:hypothetical protein|nr:hypothetical protein [Mycobacterium sp.]